MINEMRIRDDRYCILQEDNDNSHGTRSRDNVVVRFKAANWITTLIHPPQSPDLNPSEAEWNILKQRDKRRQFRTVAELKEVLLDEWNKITMDEIRARISDMPRRCRILADENHDGGIIKLGQW